MSAQSFPRFVVGLIVSLAGGAGFLFSVAALRLGLDEMGPRYALAALAAYAVFLLLVRVWIAAQRRGLDFSSLDLPDPFDLAGGGADTKVAVSPFRGGSSGGGGASGAWESGAHGHAAKLAGKASKSASGIGLDADELGVIVLGIAVAVASALAIAYVVYIAPALLAEVALDAALVSGMLRRLRREEARHWMVSVLRKTAFPVLGLASLLMIFGTALQRLAPDARSIGPALESIFK